MEDQKRLNQGQGHMGEGGACQQWTGPGYKDPIRHPKALKLKAKFQPCPPHVRPGEPAEEPFGFLIHWIRWEREGSSVE